MRVVVTGASGFVGGAVVRHLSATPRTEAVAAIRRSTQTPGIRPAVVGELGPDTDWGAALAGADAVVHCAARVHQLHDRAARSAAEYRRVNVEGTLRLAREAARLGVRRLVFLSTVKVHGEVSPPGHAFTEGDAPAPADFYALSKLEAELGLRRIAEESGLEVVVLRAPLVYGANPKANLLRLLKWIDAGLPLPFAAIRNHRSMISIRNLVSIIDAALAHQAAAGSTFLLSDQQDVSTPDLIRTIAGALGRPPRLWPVPVEFLRAGARLAGRTDDMERLVGSLRVDSSLISRDLGWRPVQAPYDGLAEMVASFIHREK